MGNRPIIDFLIERGAPVDFFTTCVLGDADRVRAEIAVDPSSALARGIHDLPSLYFAAIGGSQEVAELLLAAGAGVNEQALTAAPIHGAVMGGNPKMIRWLLDRDADPEAPDYEGGTARELAKAMNREDLAGLF
jgi:ankyrin repeat protein